MQSALSLTAWITSSRSLVVMARIASRSLTSARPSISSLVVISGFPLEDRWVWWSVSAVGGRAVRHLERVDEVRDQLLPRLGVGQIELDGSEQEEAEAEGVAEPHDGFLVERWVDGPGGLRLGDELGELVAPQVERLAHAAGHLGIAPRRHERLEQQRAVRAEVVGDEVGSDGGEDVGDLALELVLVEEAVELVVLVGLDGRQQQLGLPAEAAVDRAGRVARSTGDLRHTSALVALLGEHLGGRRDQLLPDRVGLTSGCDLGQRRRVTHRRPG